MLVVEEAQTISVLDALLCLENIGGVWTSHKLKGGLLYCELNKDAEVHRYHTRAPSGA